MILLIIVAYLAIGLGIRHVSIEQDARYWGQYTPDAHQSGNLTVVAWGLVLVGSGLLILWEFLLDLLRHASDER